MNTNYVELYIEELVLHGFEPKDRYRIARAMEGELRRLFAEHGMPPSFLRNGEIDHLDSGAFEVAPKARAQPIGAQVAQTIYGGLSR